MERLVQRNGHPAPGPPLSTVLIDQRLYVYGLELCVRLRYSSIATFANKIPLDCARAVTLAQQPALHTMLIHPGHPLESIRTAQEPSLWIDLPGLFLLFQWSTHPLASRFAAWMALQRSAFLAAVPACLLSEGLWLVREAIGPTAQVLAELSGTGEHGYLGASRRVFSPPRVCDLSRLVVSCLKSETDGVPA